MVNINKNLLSSRNKITPDIKYSNKIDIQQYIFVLVINNISEH